ncbi:unnamed protein product [Wickerhamomyces anomalus]
MELAGLAVAEATHKSFPLLKDVLVLVGPGNNGEPPFNEVIQTVNKTSIPILSVDIPSGWDVDDGFVEGGLRNPDVLVSLTAPKPVANHISEKTQHYVGGRFIGPKFAKKYGIDQYDYRGYDQVLKLSKI